MKLSLITAGGLLIGLFATGCSFMSSTEPGGALGLGGAPTCESVACGGNATDTMKICTSTTSEGACAGISYAVGGKKFTCASCTSCDQAATEAEQACGTGFLGGGTAPNEDAGTGSVPDSGTGGVPDSGTGGVPDSGTGGGVDSGTGGSSGTTCSGQIACGSGGVTYDECTTLENGVCTQITYQTSDGQTYSCTGCSDCTSAATELGSYCTGTGGTDAGTGGTTCSGSVACGSNGTTYEVCTTTDGTGVCSQIVYQTSDGQSFDCSGCSDCGTAAQELSNYCSAGSSGGQQCGSVTCGSAAACCTCSGQQICYSLPPGSTCADIGAGCS